MLLEKGASYGPQGFTWEDFKRLQEQFSTGLPQGSGMAYSAKHLLSEIHAIEQDDILFAQSQAFTYLATICWVQFSNTATTLHYAGDQRSYFLQSANDGYHLAYKCINAPLNPLLSLQQLSAMLYREYKKAETPKYARDIYKYIGQSIVAGQLRDIKHMQIELLLYMERIRQAAMAAKSRQEAIAACCFVLRNYH